MKIKVIEVTKEERTNLFNFLVNRSKTEFATLDIEVDEVDEYLNFIQQSISIQKFEIELNNIVKIIFSRISFIESQMPDNEFVVEKGQAVLKPTGKISQTIMYYSSFYELEDDTFIDITQDDCILFGYL
jgi:hypothetical protein